MTKVGIKLFDDSDNEVFDTGYLTGTQILPYGTTPVQSSYSLDPAFWAKVTGKIGSNPRSFRYVVYGGADFFRAKNEGSQVISVDFITGVYWSNVGEIIVQP